MKLIDRLAIPSNLLIAIKDFVAKQDAREHLHHIFVEVGFTECRLCATNGYVLGVARCANNLVQGPKQIPFRFLLPVSLLKGLVKDSDYCVSVADTNEHFEITLTDVQETSTQKTIVSKELVGRFPPYRKTLPDTGSTYSNLEASWLDPKLINTITKAAISLNAKVEIVVRGHNATLFKFNRPDFYAVAMPLRDVEAPNAAKTPPAWIADTLETKLAPEQEPVPVTSDDDFSDLV